MTLDLHEIAETAADTLRKEGHHEPLLYIEGSRDTITYDLADLPEQPQRLRWFRQLGVDVAVKQGQTLGELVSLVHITQSRTTILPKGETLDEPSAFLPPSLDPRSQEELMATQYTVKTNTTEAVFFKIQRNSAGKVIGVTPDEKSFRSMRANLLVAFTAGWRAYYSHLS